MSRTSLAFLVPGVILAVQLSLSAQVKCGFAVAGYADEGPVIGRSGIVEAGRLSDISAYVQEWDSGRRHESVPSGNLRFFGDMVEGDYRIYVGKPGYKTTIYGFHLGYKDAVYEGNVVESIRLWKGSSTSFVNNATTKPSQIPQMRLNVLTKQGSINAGDTNSDTATDRVGTHSLRPLPKIISGGVLDGKAISLPKPEYPPAARAVHASGTVSVQVVINETGDVISAKVVGGSYPDPNTGEKINEAHPLLIAASEAAARAAKFSPTLLNGQPVKVSGVITYTFVP